LNVQNVVTVNNRNSVTNSTNSSSLFNGNINNNGTTDYNSNNGNTAYTIKIGIPLLPSHQGALHRLRCRIGGIEADQ